jgi:3-keto-disaccharide hydrolase
MNRETVLRLAVCLFLMAGLVVGQQPKDPCARTSATGYSDTPVIPGQKWKVHDIDRPHPPMVAPGGPALPVPPPSDAIVLFDGKDFSHWTMQVKRGAERGKMVEPRWKLEDGYMEVVRDSGDLYTKEKYGDIQLHVEWASPAEVCGSSQWRGNGGVMIMGFYEFQVLDSVDNPTYADGQAASIYGQFPPLVNASRRRGEWQSFDIFFEAPKFDGEKLVKPAYATVIHNGVLVHHRQEIVGPVAHKRWNEYKAHEAELPLRLQDHGVPVRFRNIWVRRLAGYDQQ